NSGAATEELQVVVTDGHDHQQARGRAVRTSGFSHGENVCSRSVAGVEILFLCAVLQQALQLIHEFLYVFEIQVDGRKADIGHLVEFFQVAHQESADLGGRALAICRFAHKSLGFIYDGFQLAHRHGPFFAGLQQSLQDLLALEFFPAAILLDDHIGNLVDAFIGGKATAAFQALAATANQIAGATLARVDYLIIQVRAKRTLHSGFSFELAGACPPRSASATSSASSACFWVRANWRSSPIDHPSRRSNGNPTTEHPAKVISQSTTVAIAAGSFSTPKISVKTRNVASCEPPPTPGNCAAEPTMVKASTRVAPAKPRLESSPPKACATHK